LKKTNVMDYINDKMKLTTCAFIIFVLVLGTAPCATAADNAAGLFQKANSSYVELCRDVSKKKIRENWIRVIHEFALVEEKAPDSGFAPEAAYKGAKVYEHLSRYSGKKDDAKTASRMYQDVAGKYPKSRVADKALFNSGMLEEKLGNLDKAGNLYRRIVEDYSQEETAGQARDKLKDKAFHAEIPTERSEPVTSEDRVPFDKGVEKNKQETKPEKDSGDTVIVKKIRHWPTKDNIRIAVDVEGEAASYKTFVLPGAGTKPYRLVMDITGAKVSQAMPSLQKVDQGFIADIRVSQNDVRKVRIVIDLKEKPFYETFTMNDPYRILIDVGNTSASINSVVSYQSKVKKVPRGTHAQINEDTPSIASQLCLKVSRIVIDPGHGGKDPGAISPTGTREKDLTLEIGKLLTKKLKTEGFEVFLTRTKDVFLTLEERTVLANKKRADLFISIHINSHQNSNLSGIETYFLNLTTDASAIEVAARENAAVQRSMSDLQLILNDLMLNSKINESSKFANSVHTSVVSSALNTGYDGKNLGVKQAPFYVLLGAQMPAILLELGFLTNSTDIVMLKKHTYQETLVEGIAKGVNNYIMNTTYAYSWRSR